MFKISDLKIESEQPVPVVKLQALISSSDKMSLAIFSLQKSLAGSQLVCNSLGCKTD